MAETAAAGRAYGGFFPLEIPRAEGARAGSMAHLAEGRRFYDARSAIAELLRSNGIVEVIMPGYICPAVYRSIEMSGSTWRTYKLSADLRPDYDQLGVLAKRGGLLIVCNYFGVFEPDLEALEELIDITGCKVMLDCAQALYYRCPDRFAAVYSPRKFMGIPDGGIMVTGRGSRLREPALPLLKVDEAIFGDHAACLARRGEYPHGEAQDLWRRLEKDMPTGPLRMSDLASLLFDSFDFDSAAAARCLNYDTLREAFADTPPRGSSAPLCFPLRVEPERFAALRRELADRGVSTALYWPDLPEAADDHGKDFLALPVDSRCGPEDMKQIARIVSAVIGPRS